MVNLQSLQQPEVLKGSSLDNTDLIVLQMTTEKKETTVAVIIFGQFKSNTSRDTSEC